MIAAILAAEGRDPVHNRAGSNMTWGVATALLEQRGSEGLFEVDEAWLPKVAAELDPSLIVLGNLFRDQLDRYGEIETLADEWAALVAERAGRTRFVLNADDPLIADLGRDAEQSRRDGVVYFGIDDPSQALPELQHASDAKHCRRCGHPYAYERAFVGHLGHYSCPNCGAARPQPRRRRDRDRPARHERLDASPCGPRAGELRLELPLPGLYNVYNALAALAAGLRARRRAASGRRPRSPTCAPPSAGSRRSRSDGKPVSILLIKNPAGANEVLRTLRLEAGGERLDLWIALNDRIADGRDVSWVWDADFELLARLGAPRHLRRHAGAGDGAAAEIRRLAGGADRGRAGDRRLPRPRGRRRARAPLRPPHLHRPARAAQAALLPRPGEGVLASEASDRRRHAVIWHDVECGGYEGDLELWRELAGSAEGPILDLGCGTGRVALDLARHGHRLQGLDLDPELVAAFNERAAAAGLPAEAIAGDARDFALEREFALVLAPMQLIQVLDGPAERLACLRCAARHLRPGGSVAVAIVDGFPDELTDEAPLPSPTPARSTAGSTPACRWTRRSTRARSSSAACARPSPRPAS